MKNKLLVTLVIFLITLLVFSCGGSSGWAGVYESDVDTMLKEMVKGMGMDFDTLDEATKKEMLKNIEGQVMTCELKDDLTFVFTAGGETHTGKMEEKGTNEYELSVEGEAMKLTIKIEGDKFIADIQGMKMTFIKK